MAARNAWLIRDLHCDVKAKFHYTGQTRPDRTHADFVWSGPVGPV